MNIGIDIRVLARGETTGIQVYTRELLSRLFARDSEHRFTLFYNAYRKTSLPRLWREHPRVKIIASGIPNKAFDVAALLGRPRVDRLMGGVDVFFQPHFLRAPLSSGCPRVVVAHDLSFEFEPQWFSRRSRLWHIRMNPARRLQSADHIIAVSNTTKRDLVRTYAIDQEDVTVVHSGVEYDRFRADQSDIEIDRLLRLPQKFFLLFSAWDVRKNMEGAIAAYERFYERAVLRHEDNRFVTHGLEVESRSSDEPNIPHLLIAGAGGSASDRLYERVAASPVVHHIRLIGRIPERLKPALLQRAFVLVFPSFFEGFGLPPLEALAASTPVIAGDRGALPEILNDAALLIDPWDVDDIATAMMELWGDASLYERMIVAGIKRVQQFSWDETARQTEAVLEHVAASF